MTILLAIFGLALLILGGHFLVQGAVSVAEKFGVSSLLIGLTLVGFGTSMPELVTSLQAAFAGSPGIAVGNVIGSNIANILLILGASAIIFPVVVNKQAFKRDATFLVLASLLTLGVVLHGQLTAWMGLGLLTGMIAYIVIVVKTEISAMPTNVHASAKAKPKPLALLKDIGRFVVGLVITIIGAKFLVSSAIEIAGLLGVSETVIGVTIVAVGTSMPELVTSIVASLKKQGNIAYGNIIGSNIYNVFGIVGATAIIKPISVPPALAQLDIWVMCGAAALLVLSAITGWKVCRKEGFLYIALYAAYVFAAVHFGALQN